MEFRLLGPLEVLGDDGRPLPLGGRRPRALLTILLLHANEPVSTDRLIDDVWGESPPASAAGALQVHVHALRKALGADRIVTRPPGYLVRVDEGELDVERFDRLVAAGEPHRALALWRGPALADVAFEPFAQADAAQLEEARLAALEKRIADDLERGRHAALVGELEGLAATHPHREPFQAQRILALYRSGRQAEALAAYQTAREALDELGLEPSRELRALERRVLEQDPGLAPVAAVGHVPEEALPTLIGRDLERTSVAALLRRPDTRLATLTGPGGTGKTSLALAVAGELGGAPFVDLAPLTDPALVLPGIGSALGVDEVQGEPVVETLRAACAERGPTLVVVDNLEHLTDAFADLAALLQAVPGLQILATSRVPLRIALEREYRVPPLAVPDLAETDTESIAGSAAVRLYVDRAQQSVPGFELSEANAEAVARITRALDGLPLAIELAAARMRVLGLQGTSERLGEALSLLRRSAPDLPERQRSLRATIEWSVRLLDAEAARVLRTLAAFPGGATLGALETVAETGTDVAGALDVLLDASLITSTFAAGEPRFGMLETIRAYAAAELEHDDPGHTVRSRQLGWCIELAAGGTEKYWMRGTPWLDRVEPELANVRAGLDFAHESGNLESEVQLTTLMRHYWRVRGHGIEARRRLEDLYAQATSIAPALRARLEQETAVMRMAVGDFDGARALWHSAIATYAQLGDDVEIGRTYAELAACANASGDTVAGIEYGERAAAMLAQDEFIHLIVLGNLAEAYEQTGDLVRARETAHRVLEAQRKNGDRDGVGYMSFTLASVALAERDLDEAHRRLVECLTVADEVGFVELTAYGLGAAAALAVALGALDDAAFLLGACQESFERTGVTPHAYEASRQARVLASLREELAEPDEAIAGGAKAGSDAAVVVALALGSRIAA